MKKLINVIKNPKILIVRLLNNMHFLSDEIYLRIRYRLEFGDELNLETPKTFNEKLNWLKINDRNPIYSKLVDKYEARKYIKNTIGEEYLIPFLGIWDKWEDIDFAKLPEQFVLKCTHDSGSVVICKDKNFFDYKSAKKKLKRKMKMNLYWWAREWPYKNAKPRIIAEQYMNDGIHQDMIDYKFFCFNGEPEYIYISENMSDHSKASISFFDMNFQKAHFRRTDYKDLSYMPEKPENFDKMMELSRILSKGHKFLRVDFYDVLGKIYFGELTFFPAAGFLPIVPEEWDLKLGEMLNINDGAELGE